MSTSDRYLDSTRNAERGRREREKLLKRYKEIIYKCDTEYEVRKVAQHAQAFGGGVHHEPEFTEAVSEMLKKLKTD